MALKEDIKSISEKECFETPALFMKHYIIDEGWSFFKLKTYIETKYKRYYSRYWIYSYGCELLKVAGFLTDECPNKFTLPVCDAQWQAKAESLGYKTVKEMLIAYKGKKYLIAEKFGLSRNGVYNLYKQMGV